MADTRARQLAVFLFLAGFFTSTWDKLLYLDLGGFTLKIQQLCFALAFGFALWSRRRENWRSVVANWHWGFAACTFLLGLFYMLGTLWSAFPLKTFLYSGWLLFNLFAVWGTAQLIAPYVSKTLLIKATWVALAFHTAVILADHVAYQFGFTGGLIGFNQDSVLGWGVSRPHAFSNEPSYIAAFFAMTILLSFTYLWKFAYKIWVPFSLANFVAITATTSRTGLLSLCCGLVALLSLDFWRNRRIPWINLAVILGLIVSSLGILVATTPKAQRQVLDRALVSSVIQGKDGSGNSRLEALRVAWVIAKDTKFLGIGLGASYRYWTQLKVDREYDRPEDGNHGHELIMSIWGQLLAEGGIIALLLYGTGGFLLTRALWRAWRVENSPLQLGSLVSCLIFFGFIALWLGNIARGDSWVWFAIWSRMALPDAQTKLFA